MRKDELYKKHLKVEYSLVNPQHACHGGRIGNVESK